MIAKSKKLRKETTPSKIPIPAPWRIPILLIAVALFPFINRNPYHIDVMVTAGIFILLALGLNVIVGFAGILNLGYAALFAVGAYTYALVNLHFGIPFW